MRGWGRSSWFVAATLAGVLGLFGCGGAANAPAPTDESTGEADVAETALTEVDVAAADQAIIDDVLDNFSILASVPRQSGHEKEISDTLKGWAENLGLTVRQNDVFDLIIDVPATAGLEGLPLVCLQAHMDMVCVAADDRDFDPQKDTPTLVLDEEAKTLTADGTSLGADDGAGVAIIMSIVEGRMAHGPLLVLFTVDEEYGMSGVNAITVEDVRDVRYLINVDSEESDTITVSSAAGATLVARAEPRMVAPTGDVALTISLSGLLGGHSGVDIDKGRLNANRALAETLTALAEEIPFELAMLRGGSADNAIAKKAMATIVVREGERETIETFVEERQEELETVFGEVGETPRLAVDDADMPDTVLRQEQTTDALDYLTQSASGVLSMSEVIEGLVESSCNIGLVRVGPDGVVVRVMPRSSSAERFDEILAHQAELAESCGLEIEVIAGPRAWPPNPASVLVPRLEEVYLAQNGKSVRVVAVHAGLECGAFAELSDTLDIASIGPDVTGAHTPDETLHLASIPKVWHWLETVLCHSTSTDIQLACAERVVGDCGRGPREGHGRNDGGRCRWALGRSAERHAPFTKATTMAWACSML